MTPPSRLLSFALFVVLSSALPLAAGEAPRPDRADPTAAVAAILDDFHDAAASADEERYFRHFAPEGIFLGTDATERWDVAAFRRYAHPHFAKGSGWRFVPRDRHVVLSPSRDVAWFDELLDSTSYGECRGSGVLRLVGTDWKIAQYHLTIPVPNELAKELVSRIRSLRAAPASAASAP